MNEVHDVAEHYTHGDLLGAIRLAIGKMGKTPEAIGIEDLAPVDEFHIGGRVATRDFLDQLSLVADDCVLDIGCGIGGASRFAAHTYGCRVTGVDLTDEYVQTGNTLCAWLGMNDRISLRQGTVLALPIADRSVDKAFMLHVGMNIQDKTALAAEVWRTLKPGGMFGIYDVMRMNDESLTFPVPWATVAETSWVASPAEYRHALTAAGFEIFSERNRRDFALDFFEQLRAKMAGTGGPPPLGLHILMGASASAKIQNVIENIARNRVAPVELIARKA
jgi:SAM-dependent methyltransferase